MTPPPHTLPPIVAAGHGEFDTVCDLTADTFTDLAATAWLVPNESDRRRVLRGNFAIMIEHALINGTVHVFDDRSGAAVWLTCPTPPPARYEHRRAAASGDYADRFATLDRLFETNHPDQPHHHLLFLAVRTDQQRTGRGTALLRHHHAYLDAHRVPAYLDASSTGSRELYARHGYQPRPAFTLPNGTAFWPMLRPPHPAERTASETTNRR